MKVSAYGMAVEAPAGWEVRIGRRSTVDAPGSQEHPLLHAATVPLPEQRGDFGGGVTGLLGQADVFVALLDFGAGAADRALFAADVAPNPTPADFSPSQLQRTLAYQSGRQWFFTQAGRGFCLYVVLGSHARRAELVQRLQPLLATLTLGPA